LRRQVAREHPDIEPGQGLRGLFGGDREAAASTPAAERVARLEQLAVLHDRGVLSDTEFNSEKLSILNGS
jgi:hypothetical protein